MRTVRIYKIYFWRVRTVLHVLTSWLEVWWIIVDVLYEDSDGQVDRLLVPSPAGQPEPEPTVTVYSNTGRPAGTWANSYSV